MDMSRTMTSGVVFWIAGYWSDYEIEEERTVIIFGEHSENLHIYNNLRVQKSFGLLLC